MQEKKANRSFPRPPKWLLFVPLGLLALYVTVQLVAVLDNRYETETAIQDTLADSVELDGVLLFAQQPVDGEGSLGYLVEEGERVSAGTAVAEIYTSSEQASLRNQLTVLQNRIALLEKSESVGTDIGVLLNQEQNAENDLLEALDRKDYENLNSRQESYLLAANKLQVTTGRVANFDTQLAELNAQAESLTQQLGTPQTIPAPVGGYFVQAQEARMLTVEADALNNASPAELQEMLDQGADESLEGKAGKIVTSYQWNLRCLFERRGREHQPKGGTGRPQNPDQLPRPGRNRSAGDHSGSNAGRGQRPCKNCGALRIHKRTDFGAGAADCAVGPEQLHRPAHQQRCRSHCE